MDNAEEYGMTVRGSTKLDCARARCKFGAPMFEPEIVQKQMYCTEVLVTLLGHFGAPQSFGALIVIRRPGNCAPSPSSLRP